MAMGHVHGLGVDPSDDTLYAATHFGLFRIDDGRAVRVAARWQDTMAFTVVGDRHFLGSGHPDLREDLPVHLGLIESTDAGETWRPLAMQGEADFHALEPAGPLLYGYDAVTGTLMVSSDRRRFQPLTKLHVVDLAADPSDPDRVLATTARGGLVAVDAATGRSRTLAAPPLAFVDWPDRDVLAGLDPDATIQVSGDGGRTWDEAGEVPGNPAALEVTEHAWYVATDQGVFASDDDGQTWARVLSMPRPK
jgi:hypothetical protein